MITNNIKKPHWIKKICTPNQLLRTVQYHYDAMLLEGKCDGRKLKWKETDNAGKIPPFSKFCKDIYPYEHTSGAPWEWGMLKFSFTINLPFHVPILFCFLLLFFFFFYQKQEIWFKAERTWIEKTLWDCENNPQTSKWHHKEVGLGFNSEWCYSGDTGFTGFHLWTWFI